MTDLQLVEADETNFPPLVLVALLGSFRLSWGQTLMPFNQQSKAATFLSALALAGQRRLSRAEVLERVWPECESALAKQSLNSLTYRLNKLTHTPLQGAHLVTYEEGEYSLNIPGGVGVDVERFDHWRTQGVRCLHDGDAPAAAHHFEQALLLYRGDLYGDPSIHTIIERERLRAAFLDTLSQLANHHYCRQDPTATLHFIHRLLQHDPCREDAHRMAMRCYVLLGQRAQALRQYRVCCQVLMSEFDAPPEQETLDLYNQIRQSA